MSKHQKYQQFLKSKRQYAPAVGFDVSASSLNPRLFAWQRDIVRWAFRKGRAALFLDTGLGKTFQQLEWAHRVHWHTGGNVLILTPLAVGRQTLLESSKFGIDSPIKTTSSQEFVETGITITNYEKLHKFDASQFTGVVLDESSIIKHHDSKRRAQILDAFSRAPYRLACTATPAPNDQMELGNHAEFLGVMSRTEMLAMYFTHDGGNTSKWRLKRHAESKFYEWMSSWGVMIRRPSDIGYDDSGYDLPPLNIQQHEVESGMPANGRLFAIEAKTLSEQREARRQTISERVKLTAELANADRTTPWVIWCELNDESKAAAAAIPDAVEITGSMPDWKKEQALIDFSDGTHRVIVTKPSIAGFGLNWQHCHNMAFLGLSHSYEQFYQAIRRCYRFGQQNTVNVHIVTSDRDGSIVANIQRKHEQSERMQDGMVAAMGDITRSEITATRRETATYQPSTRMEIPEWLQTPA